jgi:hypothetical protein
MKKQNLKNLAIQKNTISQITGGANANQQHQQQAVSGFLSCVPQVPVSQRQTCQYSCIQSCYCL